MSTPTPHDRKSPELEGARGISRPQALAHEVYEVLYGQLLGLRIAPGARITVDALARELNVSQTPIREALSRLEREGLVVKTHLVGYSAAPQISRRHFDELYELRLLLETDAARSAALRMDDEKLTFLQGVAGVMSRRRFGDDRMRYSAFARDDAVFHDKIMEFAGNELIRHTLAGQHTHFHIFRLMFHRSVTEEALDEHEKLLEAFANRNGDAAKEAMREHIERSRQRLLPAFE